MKNTKTNSKKWFAKVSISVVAFAAVIILAFAVALAPHAKPAQQTLSALGGVPLPAPTQSLPTVPARPTPTPMGNCPANWDKSSDAAVRAACEKLKASNYAQQHAAEIATMQARPYSPVIPNFTPVTLLPVPDYANTIRQLKFDPYNGAWPFMWEGATSVWQIHAVPNSDYTSWNLLFIVAYQGNGVRASDAYASNRAEAITTQNPTLTTMVLNGDRSDAKYSKSWVYPKAVGEVYITNVTIPPLNIPNAQTPFPSLQGTVYFKAKNGQTGSFDLAHETWTFDTPAKAP